MSGPAEEHTGCLHLVAGDRRRTLADCLAHAGAGDALFFIDAGVFHCLRSGFELPAALRESAWFAEADLDARGLLAAALDSGLQVADDTVFVRLLKQHRHCLTWK